MKKHENLKKIKNLKIWQNSRKLNYFANVFINEKIQFLKNKIVTVIKFVVKITSKIELDAIVISMHRNVW